MSDAGEARDRLAALLPAVGVRPPLRGPIGGVVVSMTPDRATALADEIEAGRAAVAEVAALKRSLLEAITFGDAAVAAVARVEALMSQYTSWDCTGQIAPDSLARALAPAAGTYAASGDGDG